MFKRFEKKFNNRLLERIVGGSYLGDHGQRFFEKLKKIGREAYAHILALQQKFTERYRN